MRTVVALLALLALLALVACAAPRTGTSAHAVTSPPVGAQNARDYGAVGDGAHDDRAAIQAALDACAAATCAGVFVPDGQYRVGAAPSGSYCLRVPAGVALRGQSENGTVIVEAAGVPPATRAIYATGPGIRVETLTLDGDRAHQDADAQRHGVFATGAPGIAIERVTARSFSGDGFYLYLGTDDARVEDSSATGNGRNGITFGGATRGGMVARSSFVGNLAQQFDSEPGPGTTVDELAVVGNRIDVGGASAEYALTVSGSGSGSRSSGWVVSGNEIVGAVFVVWANDVAIVDNRVTNATPHAAVSVYRASARVSVLRNRISQMQDALDAVGAVSVYGTGTGQAPDRIAVVDNDVAVTARARSFGVVAVGALDVRVERNRVRGPGLPADGYAGVYVRATNASEPFRRAAVTDNYVADFGAGMIVRGNGAARLLALAVRGNTFDDDGAAPTMASALDLDDGTGVVSAASIAGNVAVGGASAAVKMPPGAAAVPSLPPSPVP